MLQVYEVDQDVNSPTHGRKLKFFFLLVFAVCSLATAGLAAGAVASEG